MSRSRRALLPSAALVLAACGALVLAACAVTPAVDGPIVRAPAPASPSMPPAALTIVTFNVHHGADPAGLARALVAGGLGDADVYLIQEIEDHVPAERQPRAQALAAALGTGMVYAPARRLAHGGLGTHGLAILSRWPIVDDAVLRLPYHELVFRARPRIALGVLIDVAGTPVQIWNVHLDTRIAVESRVAQLAPVFEAAQRLPGLAIVGGDLNALTRAHSTAVDALAEDAGFATPTVETGATTAGGWSSWPPLPPTRLDALYTRGFAIEGAGVARSVRGSDHVPLWVRLAWPRALPPAE